MLSTSPQVELKAAHSDSSPKINLHRRTHHKKPGRKGQVLVVGMATLILTLICVSGLFAFRGDPHPLIAGWGEITRLIVHGLFVAVALVCMISLYRGSVSMKHLIAGCSLLLIIGFAVLVTLNVLSEGPVFWTGFNLAGLATAAFAAWVCLFSRTTSRFLALQIDRPH